MGFPRAYRLVRRAGALATACLACLAVPAGAQIAPDATRGSLQLDQRNEQWGLQLRQWQQMNELNRASGGDPNVRREMETLHLQQRQRQDALQTRQLQEYDSSSARRAQTQGIGGPAPLPADVPRFGREQAEQTLRQDSEREELDRRVRAQPRAEPPPRGPTLDEVPE